ncbi:hypothetical protein JCM21900_002570 [Sporobolomyces salmonicolor]
MSRPPPYLRTQSSPTLPPTPSPTSSTFIGAPTRSSRPQQSSLADSLLETLPLPHLVFDPFLRLSSFNGAANSVFGLASGGQGFALSSSGSSTPLASAPPIFPPGGADAFFCLHPAMKGATVEDQIRGELERLAEACEERERDAGGQGWGEGVKVELKSERVPGLKWAAEAKVRRFVLPGEEADPIVLDWSGRKPAKAYWFSVLLMRPWQARPVQGGSKAIQHQRHASLSGPPILPAVAAATVPISATTPIVDPSTTSPALRPNLLPTPTSTSPPPPSIYRNESFTDRTPTLGSALAAANPFSSAWGMFRRELTQTTPGRGGACSEFAKSSGAMRVEEEESVEYPEKAQDWAASQEAPYKPLRLPPAAVAAANGFAQPNSGSAGTDSSSSGGNSAGSFMAGSETSHSTAGTSTSSQNSGSAGSQGRKAMLRGLPGGLSAPPIPEALRGMGISVSSAGIQLSQSNPAINAVPSTSASSAQAPAYDVSSTSSFEASVTTPTPSSSGPAPLSLAGRITRPHPLSLSRSFISNSSASPSSSSSGSNPHAPLMSPRPTALPPLPPKPTPPQPDCPSLLKFAALANFPKTGVILADSDLASGYVNGLARELLMGVAASDSAAPFPPSTASTSSHRTDDDLRPHQQQEDEWWNYGCWSTEDEPWSTVSGASGSVASASSTSSAPFFSTISSPSVSSADRPNPFDGKDLMLPAIIAAGEATTAEKGKGTAGSSLRIGKPSESNRYRATVAGILARSLASYEKRRAALGRGGGLGLGGGGGGFGSPGAQSFSSGTSGSPTAGQIPAFIAAGGVGAHGKKPYKVFDHSFSQRVIDPLEPMLELCARQGEYPPSTSAADDDDDADIGAALNGMIVGVEVEVWEAAAPSAAAAEKSDLKHDSFVTANVPAMHARKKRVRRRIVEVTAAPIFAPRKDGGRQHLGGMLLLRDVTDDQRRMNYSSDESRQQQKRKKKGKGETYFKQILDNMPQMVWTTTPRGSHSYFNKLWYEYTGLEPEQSLGVGWQSPFHEDDMPSTLSSWSRSLETGEPYSVEYRCQRYDGAWRWMLGRALPFRDAEGKIQGWFGTCTDFDELYKMREQLRRTLQQNAAVVQGAGCLLFALDREGIITFFQGSQKEAMLEEMSVQGEVEGQHISVLSPSLEFCEVYRQVLEGKLADRTITWQAKNGRFFRCLLTPLTETRLDASVLISGCIVVAHDVSDLVSTQNRLQQSYEERAKLQASETAATEASRLKSEFLALTSHELRTPIAHMLGLSELLLSEPLSESQKSLAAQILRSGDVLLEMIGQVLDMGKVEAGKLDLESRPFDLNELSSDARVFSTAASKKGLKFIEDIDEISPQVLGDMPRLRQVLTNLLSNAVKFTKEGSITLRIKRLQETGDSIRVRWEVQDTGVGIRKEAISSLFKPFHQADVSTSRQFGGTGLGLSISKNLIELMGGTITLSSEYGVGTRMAVELKLEKAPAELVGHNASAVPNPAPQAALSVDKEKIWLLVVDDNELNRSIITRLLTKMGFNVDSASNGYEALDRVEKKRYDLVLMDHQMDGLDGLETTVRMRRSHNPLVAGVKIIALTASALKGDQENFLASGADGYLSKPVRSAVLEATILRVLSPLPISRRSSAATTPNVETASRSGFEFGDSSFNPSAPPEHADNVASVRRRPSHPSYGAERV